ncbi:MAG: PqqD family protein, partial [Acidobacteriota bacterium]|nr:PqqD family protein [Acidobacteriota bacterium]
SVLFNPQNNKFCVLNQTAGFLWQLLEQPRTLDEMVAALKDSYDGADQADASKDVQEAVEQLMAVQCVEGIPV